MSSISDYAHPICPKCDSVNICGVEYYLTPEDYDGVSEYNCIDCGYREGRWTAKELHDNEIEPLYGHGGRPIHYKSKKEN